MQGTAPDPRRWYALALLCGAFFMVILDAAIVVVNTRRPVRAEDIAAMPALRIVVTTTSGYDHVDFAAAKRRKVAVARCALARRCGRMNQAASFRGRASCFAQSVGCAFERAAASAVSKPGAIEAEVPAITW